MVRHKTSPAFPLPPTFLPDPSGAQYPWPIKQPRQPLGIHSSGLDQRWRGGLEGFGDAIKKEKKISLSDKTVPWPFATCSVELETVKLFFLARENWKCGCRVSGRMGLTRRRRQMGVEGKLEEQRGSNWDSCVARGASKLITHLVPTLPSPSAPQPRGIKKRFAREADAGH